MKKFIIICATILLGFNFYFPTTTKAETNESSNTTNDKVEYNSLSKEEKDIFKEQGFDENNEYFQSVVVQPVAKNNLARFRVNVIRLAGSTKKVNKTKGYTTYVITATTAGFSEINMRLDYGNKHKTSSVLPYGRPRAYSGGIYFSHTGKKKYLRCKLVAQFYTSMGLGTDYSSAGGVTLGK